VHPSKDSSWPFVDCVGDIFWLETLHVYAMRSAKHVTRRCLPFGGCSRVLQGSPLFCGVGGFAEVSMRRTSPFCWLILPGM
jgi:hypothetical protein